MIHPSALIAPGAQIGPNVSIGPHTIVGENVAIDADNVIGANAVLEGHVRIGRSNRIGHGVLIGGAPQDVTFAETTRSSVRIGQGNTIRDYCTIHRGTTEASTTEIGDDNLLMVGVHIGHNCAIGNKVIIANNVLLGGYVSVLDQAFIGGSTTLHQNMRVGRLAMVQGSSAFGKDLPPFVLAAERNSVFGINVVGLRRAGFDVAQRDEVKRAFKLLYTSGLNTRQALDKASSMQWSEIGRDFFQFVADALKRRGICPYHRTHSTNEL